MHHVCIKWHHCSCTLWDNKQSVHMGFCFWFLAQRSYSPCSFLSDKGTRSMFCSNEATLGGSWVCTGHQEDQEWLEAWDFQPHPYTPERKRGWKWSYILIMPTWGNYHKIPIVGGSETSRKVNTSTPGGWCTPIPQAQKLLCSGLSPTWPDVSLHLICIIHLYYHIL